MRVRSGEHEGYSRIVFDWSRRVGYRVDRDGPTATVTFDRPARVDLARLRARPPRFIQGFDSRIRDGGLAVTVTVPETSRVRAFRSGPKVVVDVMAPSVGRPAPRKAEAASDAPSPAPAPPEPAPQAAQPAAPSKPPASSPPAAPAKPSDSLASKPTPLVPSNPQPLKPQADEGTPEAPAASAPPAPATPAKPTAVTATPIAGAVETVSLRFDWSEPVAAAVFRRAGSLWVVFDNSVPVDLQALSAAGGNVIRAIQRVPAEGATVLRFDTVAGVNPALRRDGLAWMLDFRQQPLQPPTPIEIQVQPSSPVGARIFLPVPEPGRAIPVSDPEVGDNLVVVPVIPLGHGIERAREYPQLRILASVQGVVVKPRIDDLRVRPLSQGIELTSAGTLQISPVTEKVKGDTKLATMRPLTRVFDLEEWRGGDIADFNRDKRKLLMTVVRAKDEEREQARLNLARYYFSIGFAAESLGVLNRVAADRPEIRDDPEFRALHGANQFLMGHYVDAAADLNHPSLQDNDEAIFWRAALEAAAGKPIKAARRLKRTVGIIRPYPKALKMPLGMLVATSAIATGDAKRAARQLESLATEEPTPSQASQLAYIEGRLKELSGEFDDAVAKWEEVQDGPHRPSRAKAAMARAELLLKLGKFTPAEAIEELEKLRFAWRGDDFEFGLLRRLGALYLAEGDYRSGLRTLRQAATHFRSHEKASEVTQEMANAFARLYLEGEADKLAPVTAIALYDEFKELSPAGERGDDMVRNVADRLASIDLLERAAELLDAQIKFRLKGERKARVGAQLARIHILDKKPDKAEAALRSTDAPGLPAELVAQRRHLRAQSLADAGRTPEALVVLEVDESREADELRVGFYWKAPDWRNVAQTLRHLIRGYDLASGEPLDEEPSRHILNLAIALTLGGNERGVDRLRRDHGESMDQGLLRDAFRLIAAPQTQGLVDPRTIASRVGDVEKFQGFMAAYKERLRKQIATKTN